MDSEDAASEGVWVLALASSQVNRVTATYDHATAVSLMAILTEIHADIGGACPC